MDVKYSHSMRQSFSQCPRKIYFRYCAGIERKENLSDARTVGRSFHKGIELLRHKMPLDEVLIYIRKELEGCKEPETEEIKVSAYIRGYISAYDDLQRDTKTEMRLEVGDDVGVVDCIAEDDRGSQYIIEDKTTASFDKDMEKALRLNDQICHNTWLCRENGIDIKGILYRETQKSVHKINKGESKDAFKTRMLALYMSSTDRYRQIAVDPSVFDFDLHAATISLVNQNIRAFSETFVHSPVRSMPKNCWSCLGKYGACEFLPICSGTETDISLLYKPNLKSPWDCDSFRIENGIFGEPRVHPSEIESIDFAEYPVSKKMMKFISVCGGMKIDEDEEKKLTKIINAYFNFSDFEVEQIIRSCQNKEKID